MAGRKSKLTPELQKVISDIMKAGNYARVAVEAAGINADTYYEWLKRGKADIERGKKSVYSEFSDEIERAAAIAEAAHVGRIATAGNNGSWQASAWLLERKYGERWGRNDRLRQEITGANGAPLTLVDGKAAVLELLSKRHSEFQDNDSNIPSEGE